jgi:hypothetical protein
MGGSYGRPPDELTDRPVARSRGNNGRGEGFPIAEWWEKAGNRPSEKRLAGSGRPDEKQAVAAGESDLERPARLELAANLGEVRT